MTTLQNNGPSSESYLNILTNPAAEETNDSRVSETFSHAANHTGIINQADRSHPCLSIEIDPLQKNNDESKTDNERPKIPFTKVSRWRC